ncbi:hypothetical protein SLEP1_g49826 [Rubroshorea leprosula]|uniref:Uncharacterized protein n=1 Tax=Rubroshorea leprosula TaxID=152421 RepID=A0AAV5LYZ6_9ROSI|nr:hypothetical protein SLEP1_g49826 [Rubroshorea leprosula]
MLPEVLWVLMKRAELYQEYMKEVPIPAQRGSVTPFTSWMGLDTPLDIIVHPFKAEATIWLIEETHLHTTYSHHIAKLRLSDPMHDDFVDPILPEL